MTRTPKSLVPEVRAVALRYDGRAAPRVTAKGQGRLAERILALAAEHHIPLHQDPALLALLAQVELGDEIPPELYVAVSRVLAFAYQLAEREPPPPAGDSASTRAASTSAARAAG